PPILMLEAPRFLSLVQGWRSPGTRSFPTRDPEDQPEKNRPENQHEKEVMRSRDAARVRARRNFLLRIGADNVEGSEPVERGSVRRGRGPGDDLTEVRDAGHRQEAAQVVLTSEVDHVVRRLDDAVALGELHRQDVQRHDLVEIVAVDAAIRLRDRRGAWLPDV